MRTLATQIAGLKGAFHNGLGSRLRRRIARKRARDSSPVRARLQGGITLWISCGQWVILSGRRARRVTPCFAAMERSSWRIPSGSVV
ncbi:hypothetical protein SALB1_1369 [Salinisphaera sp. LB1]|nr:hypothetical protein SALB1_1369 [Salinisphaera sp. LB1]